MINKMITEKPVKTFLYEQISDRYQKMIEAGVLKTGDKLPSVRALSKEEGVSISTTFQAYIQLEQQGLIEARPKSGFYVREWPNRKRSLPESVLPKPTVIIRETEDIIRRVYGDIGKKELIPLSMNMLSPKLLPVAKLKTSALRVLRKKHVQSLNYSKVPGISELREEIAKICFKKGMETRPEEVIITAGCTQALNFALHASTTWGDGVAVESPTYFGIFQTIEHLGRRPVEVASSAKEGIDLHRLEQAIKRDKVRACIIVTNFSNPLGAVLPDQKKKALLYLMEKYNITLIENDIYGEMYFGKTRPNTCKSFDTNGNVILCTSFSKTITPGYRIGYILPGRHYKKIIDTKLINSISTPALTQEIIADFLQNGRYSLHMNKLRKQLFTQSLAYARAIIEHFPRSTKMTLPRGGFVFWIELPKHINTTNLFNELITQGISIAPGQMFSKQADYTNYFRLSFGLPYTRSIEDAIAIIGRLIRKTC